MDGEIGGDFFFFFFLSFQIVSRCFTLYLFLALDVFVLMSLFFMSCI